MDEHFVSLTGLHEELPLQLTAASSLCVRCWRPPEELQTQWELEEHPKIQSSIDKEPKYIHESQLWFLKLLKKVGGLRSQTS